MSIDLVEDGQHLVEGGDGDEGDAETLEIEETAEVGAVVFAHLEDGLTLAFEVDSGQKMLATDGNTVGNGNVGTEM